MADYYKTEDEVVAVVGGFEDCTTSKEDFNHLSHLTVATYYLLSSGPDEAFRRVCSGLLRFITHHGVNPGKYNEPLTRAWIEEIQKVIERAPSHSSLVDATNLIIERLGNHRITIEPTNSAPDQ